MERKRSLPERSYLQYEEKAVQDEKKVYSICTSVVKRQGVWCEEKICSIRNVTSGVRVEKVCSTRKVASALREELCTV